MPLGVLAFWGGLWMAAQRYPSEYDWHYMTISSLVYPERNPDGYFWAWAGLIACGLGGLGWTLMLLHEWPRASSGRRPFGIWILGLGYLCMVCCALLPGRILRVPKGHEILAISAFIGLCIGIVQLTIQAVERGIRQRSQRFPIGPRVCAGLLAGFALIPIALAGMTQSYVSHALPQLPWVGIEWRARGVPLYLSFAFWEWITCAVFSIYSVALGLTTQLMPDLRSNAA